MSLFKEEFYTDDYDQEMLDFIKGNYNYSDDYPYPFDMTMGYEYIRFADYGMFYVTCYNRGRYLTKQQFKEKIGMVDKSTFTKDDLEIGKHVVECRNGDRYVVLDKGLLLGLEQRSGFISLDENYDDSLICEFAVFDIMKVYIIHGCADIRLQEDLPIVWQRKEKSEAQLKMEECQKQIKLLQEQMNKLQEEL